VVLAVLESLLLAFAYRASLSENGLWWDLLQSVLWTTYALFWVRLSKPVEPLPNRYPYTPSKQDIRLIWIAMALPGAGLLTVAAVLFAHGLGALS